MSPTSNAWITESNPARQNIACVLALIVGLSLATGFRHFEGSVLSGEGAGFLLGLMLLLIGAGTFLLGGKHVVTVDTKSRQILLERRGRFGATTKIIRFDEISELRVGELGTREGGSIRYHVVATLKSGEEVALFLGFFEGALSKSAMEARRQRIAHYLQGGKPGSQADFAIPQPTIGGSMQ
jgi:hypothetical protein